MNFKKLALVATLLGASVSANAALQMATDPNVETDGELILSIWNKDNQRSLTVDLGARSSDYMTNRAEAGSFALDPADVAWLGTGDIRWNIAGAATRYDEFPMSYGYYFTAPEGAQVDDTMGFTEFNAFFITFANYANRIPGMAAAGDYSVNLTYRQEGQFYAGNGAVWGDTAGTLSGRFGANPSTQTADNILNAWTADFVGNFDPTGEDPNSLTAGFAKLNSEYFWKLDLANNSLNYVETPVPAAAWLLGSALLGLAGAVRRRRKTA